MNYSSLIKKLTKNHEADTSKADMQIALAEAYFRSSIVEHLGSTKAVELLEKAIELDPYQPKFYFHLGLAKHRLGLLEEAIQDYNQSLRYHPTNLRAHYHIALACMDMKNWKLAENKLEILLKPKKELLKLLRKEGEEGITSQKHFSDNIDEDHKPHIQEFYKRRLEYFKLELKLRQGKVRDAINALKELSVKEQTLWLYCEFCLKTLFMTDNPKAWASEIQKKLRSFGENNHMAAKICLDFVDLYMKFPHESFFESIKNRKSKDEEMPLLALVSYDKISSIKIDDFKERLKTWREILEAFDDQSHFLKGYLTTLNDLAEHFFNEKSFSKAELIWNEALRYEPYNPMIFLNLANTFTCKKDLEYYLRYWNMLVEIIYLNKLAAPHIHIYDLILAQKHQAFSTKALEKMEREELYDDDVIIQWIEEKEHYFLHRQFCFESDIHILGVEKHPTDDQVEDAYQSLKRKIELLWGNSGTESSQLMMKERLTRLEKAREAVATDEKRLKLDLKIIEREEQEAIILRDEKLKHILNIYETFFNKKKENLLTESKAILIRKVAEYWLSYPYKALEPAIFRAGILQEDLKQNLLEIFSSHFVNFYVKLAQAQEENGDLKKAYHILKIALPVIEKYDKEARQQIHIYFDNLCSKSVEKMLTKGSSDGHPRALNPETDIPALRKMAEKFPDSFLPYYYLAQCYLAKNEFVKAYEMAQQAHNYCYDEKGKQQIENILEQIDDNRISYKLKTATDSIKQGNYQKALQELNSLKTDYPNHPRILHSEGICYAHLTDFERSLDSLITAYKNCTRKQLLKEIKLAMKEVPNWTASTVIKEIKENIKNKEYNRAAEELEEFLEIYAQSPIVFYYLALCEYNLGMATNSNTEKKNKRVRSSKSTSSLDRWSEIIAERINTSSDDVNLSDILPAPHSFTKPPMNYREVKNISNPLERSLCYLALARHYLTENSPEWLDSKINELERACRVNIENVILNPIAKLIKGKKYSQALDLLLTQSKKETAENYLGAKFYYSTAVCYLNTGKFDEAKKNAEEAMKQSHDDKLSEEINNFIINFNRLKSNYFLDMALHAKKTNKFELVWSHLRQAEKADSKNAIVHYYIAEWTFSHTVRDIKDKKIRPIEADFSKSLARLRKAEEFNDDTKLDKAIKNLKTQIQKLQSQLLQV